jgi:hypothetical protein
VGERCSRAGGKTPEKGWRGSAAQPEPVRAVDGSGASVAVGASVAAVGEASHAVQARAAAARTGSCHAGAGPCYMWPALPHGARPRRPGASTRGPAPAAPGPRAAARGRSLPRTGPGPAARGRPLPHVARPPRGPPRRTWPRPCRTRLSRAPCGCRPPKSSSLVRMSSSTPRPAQSHPPAGAAAGRSSAPPPCPAVGPAESHSPTARGSGRSPAPALPWSRWQRPGLRRDRPFVSAGP